MKQTAVELLKQRLIKDQQIFPIYTEYINGILYDIDNELLEMEKQQQGYSEEDMINFVEFVSKYYSDNSMENSTIYELLEQFKNK
jgi:hypothetical protein